LKERVTPSWHLFEFMDHARMLTGALKELIPACHADLYVGRFFQALPVGKRHAALAVGHIPPRPAFARLTALEALLCSGRRVMICEPPQNRLSSFAYVLLSILLTLSFAVAGSMGVML
jgi:hypothetical protein